jgi:benzylsuccinate CoA-transferase BbsF subunit
MTKRALDGVKIVEFAYVGITPGCVTLLGINGAQVVRVESTVHPDVLRSAGPFVDNINSPEHSVEIMHIHSDKMGITLNMKNPKALAVAKKLVAWADIIADGFTKGALDRMGLGYEELKKINPGIIMFSCNTFGQTGPLASFPSTGIQLSGLTGFTEITGWEDRSAVALGYYTDFVVPHFAIISVLAALEYKERTGKGQHIDISQYEAGLYFNAPLLLDCEVNGRNGKRHGNSLSYAAPHGVYRCKGDDRWCAIAVFTDQEWRSFCKVVNNPALADPRFTTLLSRKQHEAELNRQVEEWTAKYTPHEVMTMLQEAGVAAGAVQRTDEVIADPQVKHLKYFKWMNYPGIDREFPTQLAFVQLSKTPAEVTRPRPMMGEDNEYVYTKIAGLSDAEFTELMAEGVFD